MTIRGQRSRPARSIACAALIASVSHCGGEPLTTGLTEPLRVQGAGFRRSELPGTAPLTAEQLRAGETPERPTVTSFELSGFVLRPGEPSKSLRGRVTTDAVAIGARFAGFGSGFWVRPLGAPDPAFADEFTWAIQFDLGTSLPAGSHTLLLAAIGADGGSGTQAGIDFCVASEVPDNLNACDPKRRPPHTVISLAWDADVDLDLQVLTPEGKLVEPKRPTTVLRDEDGTAAPGAGDGTIDRDALAHCGGGGGRRESLVFSELPKPGIYSIHANLYEACGAHSVRFTLTIHGVSEGDDAGSFRQTEIYRASGVQLAPQANAGRALGLYLTQLSVE